MEWYNPFMTMCIDGDFAEPAGHQATAGTVRNA
jgi:hypothetical protein